MSYKIDDIEGIGPVLKEKLSAAGITNTDILLERAASPQGRKAVAAETGIDEKKVLKFANMADLMRIKGVGEEYSELLEAAGVDTVKAVSYTHLRAHETVLDLVCRLLLEKKKIKHRTPTTHHNVKKINNTQKHTYHYIIKSASKAQPPL